MPTAIVLVLLAAAPPALAAPSCGRQVIDDWFDNGRVDRTYARHCYADAIESLQPDVRVYSSAEEEIMRAFQRLGRPGLSPPATVDPSPGDGPVSGSGEQPPPNDENAPEVLGPLEGESASSVPIPLIVLAGLALLLIAAGSAGYLMRRYQARS